MICKNCEKDKPESAFSEHKGCANGYDTSRCKACKKAAYDWTQQPIEKRMLNRVRARAKMNGRDFNLTIKDMAFPEKCPIFDKPFIYGDPDWTLSIDRIDNDKGYVKGNIVFVSNKANRLKNNATLDDLQKIVDYYQAYKVDFEQLGKD